MKAIKILLSLLIFSVIFIAVYLSGFLYYMKITPCLPPPNIHPDGKVYTVAFAWEDQNKDGYYDEGEPAMPNVVIAHPLTLDVTGATNDKGLAETIEYKGGCPCNCWQGAYVEVVTPQGYVATRETKQLLTGENQTLLFGFARAN
jgi:hypothetical protein